MRANRLARTASPAKRKLKKADRSATDVPLCFVVLLFEGRLPYDFAAMETLQIKPALADLGARLEALRGYL